MPIHLTHLMLERLNDVSVAIMILGGGLTFAGIINLIIGSAFAFGDEEAKVVVEKGSNRFLMAGFFIFLIGAIIHVFCPV